LDLKGRKTNCGENYIMMNFIACILYRGGWDMWHAWGEGKGVCRVLVGRFEGERPLERTRRGWENNIKMDLKLRMRGVIPQLPILLHSVVLS
jgi:hypothetical protein